MAQFFSKRASFLYRFALATAAFAVAAFFVILGLLNRSSWWHRKEIVRVQPVLFSHKHHANELGIDCRYCHTSVENASFAGMPPTDTCLTCHSQMWTDSPLLAPVVQSEREKKPLQWVRVNDLPDFVYFDHSIHVQKGVACVTCHGPVGDMPLTWRGQPLQMQWCLSCHRDPAKHIGPMAAVFRPTIQATEDWREEGGAPRPPPLLETNGPVEPVTDQAPEDAPLTTAQIPPPAGEQNGRRGAWSYDPHVQKMTNCSTCHR